MYQPKLIIGVQHIPRNIERVKFLLEDCITPGTKVGTEAYKYPLDNMYFRDEFVEFFNAVGEFVISNGGLYVPLQREEDLRQLHLRDVKCPEFQPEYNQAIETCESALKRTCDLKTESQIASYVDMVQKLGEITNTRLNVKYGLPSYNEVRDNTLTALTASERPEFIIAGIYHTPALVVDYPDSPLVYVLSNES